MPPREPVYDEVLIRPNVRVPMRDGTLLATDIYLPAENGSIVSRSFPALLQRTPYNKGPSNRVDAMRLARHGYIVAVQDVRGRYESDGVFDAFAQEAEDGYDAIEWLAAQPPCDGRVGTFGASYLAYAQAAAATQAPPHLAAMCHYFGYPHGYHSVRQGGALDVFWLSYFVQMAMAGNEARANPDVAQALKQMRFSEWLERYPLRRGLTPLALAPSYERLFFDYVEHECLDAWWRAQPGLCPADHLENWPDVPTLWVCGWFDHYPYCHPDTLVFNRARALGHERHYVVFGPWAHGDVGRQIGQTTFGDSSTRDAALPDYELRWFDRWLKGNDDDGLYRSRVRYFVMGGGSGTETQDGLLEHGGEWREADTWVPEPVDVQDYYLQPNGGLSLQPPELAAARTSYRSDPDDPAPSSTGVCYTVDPTVGRINRNGAWDQVEGPHLFGCTPPYLPLAARHDIVVFQTDALSSDVEVVGHPVVELWFASDAPDTDFVAKLIDVYPPSAAYPNGIALGVSEGVQRAKFRNGLDAPALLDAGHVYRLRIRLRPLANRFTQGHRLRLDITSSSWPHFEVNTQTGRNPSSDWDRRLAVNTIYHQSQYASRLLLPVAVSAAEALS